MRIYPSKCGAFSVRPVLKMVHHTKMKKTIENLFKLLIWFIFITGLWLAIHFIHSFNLQIITIITVFDEKISFLSILVDNLFNIILKILNPTRYLARCLVFSYKSKEGKNEFNQEINQSEAFEVLDPVDCVEGEFYNLVTKNQEIP